MKKEKQQKRPKRTKAQRVQALKTFAVDTVYDVVGSILFAIGVYTFAKSADFAPGADLQLFVGSAHRHDDPYHQHSHHHHQL